MANVVLSDNRFCDCGISAITDQFFEWGVGECPVVRGAFSWIAAQTFEMKAAAEDDTPDWDDGDDDVNYVEDLLRGFALCSPQDLVCFKRYILAPMRRVEEDLVGACGRLGDILYRVVVDPDLGRYGFIFYPHHPPHTYYIGGVFVGLRRAGEYMGMTVEPVLFDWFVKTEPIIFFTSAARGAAVGEKEFKRWLHVLRQIIETGAQQYPDIYNTTLFYVNKRVVPHNYEEIKSLISSW